MNELIFMRKIRNNSRGRYAGKIVKVNFVKWVITRPWWMMGLCGLLDYGFIDTLIHIDSSSLRVRIPSSGYKI